MGATTPDFEAETKVVEVWVTTLLDRLGEVEVLVVDVVVVEVELVVEVEVVDVDKLMEDVLEDEEEVEEVEERLDSVDEVEVVLLLELGRLGMTGGAIRGRVSFAILDICIPKKTYTTWSRLHIQSGWN